MRRCRDLGLALLLLLGACPAHTDVEGQDEPLGPDEPLRIEPAQVELVQAEDAPAQQVTLRLISPRRGDLTSRATWTFSNDLLGAQAGPAWRSRSPLTQGGYGVISARYQDRTITAPLRLKLIARPVFDDGAPADAPRRFEADVDRGPPLTLLYPLDGALLPRNFSGMNIQWRSDAAYALHRVRFDGPVHQQDFYLGPARCPGARCQYAPPDAPWRRLAATAVTGPGLLSVRALDDAGRLGGAADPASLAFTSEDVRGGLYYFSTSLWGLLRVPFGGREALPFLLGDRQGQTTRCVGCHSLTRDGQRMAALFGGGDGFAGIVDGNDPRRALRAPTPVRDGDQGPGRRGQLWNFASYSPDGSRLCTTWAGQVELRDGRSGDLIEAVAPELVGGPAVMPDWAPDGKSVVLVRVPRPLGRLGRELPPTRDFGELSAGDWILVDAGDLVLMPYRDGHLQAAQTLLAAQPGRDYHFYPSFSPDSRWIVFNSARVADCATDNGDNQGVEVKPGSCVSYDQRAARLRLIAAQPGATPMELTRATASPNRTTSWPRFSPFQLQGGRLVFITFSAKLDYGFVVSQPTDKRARRPQLWMAAIDLQEAQRAQGDPSYAPFWLPFQDPAEHNHLAYWTTDLLCQQQRDCSGGFACSGGVCVPRIE